MSKRSPPGDARQEATVRLRLESGLRDLALGASLVDPLMTYLQELLRWNRAYNLTAVRDPSEMVTRHLLDSLAVLPAAGVLLNGARICDVGAGAGLPGIPWALAIDNAEAHQGTVAIQPPPAEHQVRRYAVAPRHAGHQGVRLLGFFHHLNLRGRRLGPPPLEPHHINTSVKTGLIHGACPITLRITTPCPEIEGARSISQDEQPN